MKEILKGPIPQSVGIIMDGNRRFAKELMKKPWKGHKFGVKKAREALKWACELGIKCLTVYVLSVDNLKSRPKKELKKILGYFDKEMDILLSKNHVVHETKTKVKFIGRLRLLPKKLQSKMKKVEEKTKKYGEHLLNIAVAYGGQQEIVDTFKKLSKKISKGLIDPKKINEKLIRENLYTNGSPYPDLIIRTGGEKRLSNFLLWQAAYSELFFTEKRWPEIDKETFLRAVKEFQKRERRFGK